MITFWIDFHMVYGMVLSFFEFVNLDFTFFVGFSKFFKFKFFENIYDIL